MEARERLVLITRWDTAETGCRVEDSLDRLQETIASWTEWTCKEEATGSRQWAGRWNKHVIRSELVLKLLTSAQSGGFAAAPTTSLPEEIGGVRNWDYRFCWIRDAALTAQALLAMGHSAEARDLLHWVERVSDPGHERTSEDRLQILYGIDGKQDLEESELSHLEGYRQSKPVRIGNKASEQAQHDIYGEVLSLAYEFARLDEAPSPHLHDLLRITADQAADCWREPDFSIWEPRNGPKHYTYSKAMVWMALDRAEQLASRYGIQGDTERWGREGREVRQYVLDNCFNAEINSFVQFPGTSDIDAALLLLPMMEILPIEDPRIQGTIDAVLRDLTENKMVYRYHTQDGIEGGEGTFVLCTFWLVDALTLSGRLDEARDIFENLVGHANHVGLLSEQIDARTGELLGNFPQAFSHIGLINSALYLAYAEGREIPVEAPMGTPAHRDCIGRKARSS